MCAPVAGAPSPQCCQALVSHHVDHSLRDEDGYTAADLAEYHGHRDCAQFLRETARQVSLVPPQPPGARRGGAPSRGRTKGPGQGYLTGAEPAGGRGWDKAQGRDGP